MKCSCSTGCEYLSLKKNCVFYTFEENTYNCKKYKPYTEDATEDLNTKKCTDQLEAELTVLKDKINFLNDEKKGLYIFVEVLRKEIEKLKDELARVKNKPTNAIEGLEL